MVTSRNPLGIKVPFNPTVATESVSAALWVEVKNPDSPAMKRAELVDWSR